MKLKLFITLVVTFISVLSSYGQKVIYENIDKFGWHNIETDDFIRYNNQDELFSCRLAYLGHKLCSLEYYEIYINVFFIIKNYQVTTCLDYLKNIILN